MPVEPSVSGGWPGGAGHGGAGYGGSSTAGYGGAGYGGPGGAGYGEPGVPSGPGDAEYRGPALPGGSDPGYGGPFPPAASPTPGAAGFTGGADNWLAGLGGLRNTVRQELVARQLDEQLAACFPQSPGAHARRRLRILDIGPGQGTQALRLARLGHLVTGLESDPAMLAALRQAVAAESTEVRNRFVVLRGDGRQTGRHFGPACFDVVLCHGVLMYVPDPEPLLAALARVLTPGGLLSLLVRNGDALAMRPGLLGDWTAALGAFGSDAYTNRLGLATRADRREPLTAVLDGIGVPLRAWYGVRIFTDTAPDRAVAPADPHELGRLLDAEEEAGRTDPYRAVAALLHLCGVRG
jgi:SAM-dependent methyltransferase